MPLTEERAVAPAAPAPAPSRPSLPRDLPTVIAGLAVLAGVVLRFVAPTPLWLDEAQSVAIARLPLADLLDALREDGAPPLYYLLLHAWTAVFGASDLAVRAPSVLASLVLLPLVAALAERVAGRAAVLPALALTALSPFAVRYATEARMYSLVLVLSAAGGLLLLRVLRAPGRTAVAGLAAVAAALLLTHYWALPLLAVVGAALLVAALRGPREVRAGARRGVLALVAGGVAFLPWVPAFLFQTTRTAAPWGAPAGAEDVVGTLLDLAGTRLAFAPTLAVGLLLLAVLGAVGLRRGGALVVAPRATGPRGWAGLLVVAVLVLGVAVAAAGGSPIAVRYAAVVVVPLLVCAAAGVALLRPRAATAVLAVVLVGGGASSAVDGLGLRTQAGEIAAALDRRAAPGDVVVVCPDQLGPGLARALEQRRVVGLDVLTAPTADPAGRVDWVDYAERRADRSAATFAAALDARARDASVWLVAAPGYRVYDGLCGDLGDALQLLRPLPERVVRLSSTAYEDSGLTRYDPRGVGVG